MHSQNNEEKIILDYFGDFIGTFCDIGANDGITFSNTAALVKRGWSGVMIEPSPKAYSRLVAEYKSYPNVYTYPYAIAGHNGKAVLHESENLVGITDVGLVSTLIPEETNRFRSVTKYNPVEIKTFRWKTALNRWRIKKFDMISIDVEGSELVILPEIDLTTVKLVVIEWNSKPELEMEYKKYLAKYNHLKEFQVIYKSPENLIYAR